MAEGRRYRGLYQIIMYILLKQSFTAYSAEVQTGLILEKVCLSWSIRVYGVCVYHDPYETEVQLFL